MAPRQQKAELTLADVISVVEKGFKRVDEKFDSIDQRFEKLEGRMDGFDTRLVSLNVRMDGIDERLGGVEYRLGKVEVAVLDLRDDVSAALTAIDSDSLTLIDHERRISRLERPE